MQETPSPTPISTRLQRIASLAKQAPSMAFTTLAHHIDVEWLREAYRITRKDGATGVDGVTSAEYEANLEENLRSLLDRAKSGTYRAPPVRRVHIPKGGGSETRPIGIPTFEDKVLQRAVVMVLEAIYEQDFVDGSYGFRPGRSAHQALQSVWDQTMQMGGGWVLEVDIRSYFDSVDHEHLMAILRRRVQDGVLLRLISKWLHAGVMERGTVTYPDTGTPQGGVVSPCLSNIFLHEVLDRWFASEVQPRMHGRSFLVRYADDATLVFSHEGDARRVLEVLPLRFGRFGLKLHPQKTRLVEFRKPPRDNGGGGGDTGTPADAAGTSGTFDLLGFTHFWEKSRRGHWVIKRKTAKSRLARALKRVAEWCRQVRHRSVSEQAKELNQKLRGHYAYYGITGNSHGLTRFHREVTRAWRKWLNRRCRKANVSWEKMTCILERYPLTKPRIMHPFLTSVANP